MRPIDDPGGPPAKPHSLTCRSHEPNGFCTCSVGILKRQPVISVEPSNDELVRQGVLYLKRRFAAWSSTVQLPADSVIEDVVRHILGLGDR